MIQEPQKVAIPALLRQGLVAFREVQGNEQRYKVRDNWKDLTYQFEPWQFFVLEVLPLCDDFPKLASVFEDRFGHSITNEEVEELFSLVADMKLFGLAADSHPLVAAFNRKRANQPIQLGGEAPGASSNGAAAKSNGSGGDASPESGAASSSEENTETNSKIESSRAVNAKEEPLPADTTGLDDTVEEKGWKLFNPTRLLKLIHPALLPFKYTVYLLPALLITALFIVFRHADILREDFGRFLGDISFIEHALISMVTVNLSVTLVTALVAYSCHATVSGFCIVFYMGFLPRFMVRIGHAQQLARREQMWLYAAPLLLRLGLFSVGILMWFNTRTMDGFLAPLGLAIVAAGALSFFLTINPLMKSSGYHLLAAVLNEPQLGAKAALALMNKLRGNVYQKLDNNILVAYALASALFMVATFAVFILMFGSYVKFHLGGAGVFLTVLIILLLILRLSEKFKKIGEVYERSVQFERWRKVALPKVEDDIAETASKSSSITYLKVVIASLIVVGLIVPYHYEPGGNFVVLPNQKQEITSEIAGIIGEIYFDGGEFLKKGAVIARINCTDYLAQVKIYTAKMQEQKAVVNDLRSKPRPEEVQVAEQALEVQETQVRFSKEKLSRLEKLYNEKTISFEELDDARRTYEVDLSQAEEKRANLQLIKSGARPDEIAAAEGKLQSYQEERDYYQEKIKQSVLYMPFDGTLVGINIKQKIGHYLDKGEPFAVAENTRQVLAQIEVPEPDMGYIAEKAGIRGRSFTYYNDDFTGGVTLIDAIVTEKSSGNVVKVLTLLDNKDSRLKSGMTGYAKISSEPLPVWKVLSLAIIRFFKVEVWSWIP